MVAAPVRSYHY